jgi:hypothetical protein
MASVRRLRMAESNQRKPLAAVRFVKTVSTLSPFTQIDKYKHHVQKIFLHSNGKRHPIMNKFLKTNRNRRPEVSQCRITIQSQSLVDYGSESFTRFVAKKIENNANTHVYV